MRGVSMSLINLTRPGLDPKSGDLVEVKIGKHVITKLFHESAPPVPVAPTLTIDELVVELGDTVFDELLALDTVASRRVLRRLDYVRVVKCGSPAGVKLFDFIVSKTSLTAARRAAICLAR